MTYSLPGCIQYISCPVVLVIDGQEIKFENGTSAIENKYDKSYLIDKMYAHNNEILIKLKVNTQINDINWCGEEQVSFF